MGWMNQHVAGAHMIIQWSTSRSCFSSWGSTGCFSWTFKGTSLAQILQIFPRPDSHVHGDHHWRITVLLGSYTQFLCSLLPNIFGPVPCFSGTAGSIKHQDGGAGNGRACHWSAAFSSAPWKRFTAELDATCWRKWWTGTMIVGQWTKFLESELKWVSHHVF